MRLSRPERSNMIATAHSILTRVEELCQKEYDRIAEHERAIKRSQELLTRLESEYVKAKELYDRVSNKK